MTCSEYLVDFLIKKGVTDVFGYAGGYIVPFMDALYKRRDEIKTHVCYNEQGCAFAAVGYFTYETMLSLLPICAMIISSFVTWNPKTQQLRALTLPTSAMWLVYNFVGGSVVAVGAEIMSEISIVIGLIRFRKKKQSVTSC